MRNADEFTLRRGTKKGWNNSGGRRDAEQSVGEEANSVEDSRLLTRVWNVASERRQGDFSCFHLVISWEISDKIPSSVYLSLFNYL